jgi:hypothetical protein
MGFDQSRSGGLTGLVAAHDWISDGTAKAMGQE